MKTKAIIFDLDGVITNTEEYHYLAWKALADKLELKFDRQQNEQTKGISRRESLDIILYINGASDRYSEEEKEAFCSQKNELYVKAIESLTPNDILPGIKELIYAAKANGLKTAVASVSKNAPKVLKSLGLWNSFDYVADAAKVKRSKPDPEIFSVCAVSLGIKPEYCIGIEDSQAGIEAIHAAGMKSVGVGVTVVSLPPDIELASTEELEFDRIVDLG